MRFTEILNIISDESSQFWNWIESIHYEGSPDTYMIEFTAYEDENYFNFNIILFDGGEAAFGFDGAKDITYIPIAVAKFISNIADRWEHYWAEEDCCD